METILDQPVVEPNASNVVYATFFQRFGAAIVDGLVLLPVAVALTFLNESMGYNLIIALIISCAHPVYKVAMEAEYGATLGKMACKIKVVSLDFEKADAGTILLRNIFDIGQMVVNVLIILVAYSNLVPSTLDFDLQLQDSRFLASQIVSAVVAVIAIVEGVMVMTDPQRRSLHDRIAGTYVIER